jgi:hydroxyethylthiazole kinase-like uncharacterized protein yjeF
VTNFSKNTLKKLHKPGKNSSGEDNGQVTIIGGSTLFHGAPLFGVKTASRIVDMVFFASPDPSVGEVASQLKSKLFSFIWVPWDEAEYYIEKSDACLIGPGFLRYRHEKKGGHPYALCDEECAKTRDVTKALLLKYPNKKWVIDAGSLQTMDPLWIPPHAILTPNKQEYQFLFGDMQPQEAAKEYKCIIVRKGPVTTVSSSKEVIEVHGGNAGLTKGGTGDTQAGLTVALLAKNEPLLAASSAAYVIKAAADALQETKGVYYNADDVADKIPEVLAKLQGL